MTTRVWREDKVEHTVHTHNNTAGSVVISATDVYFFLRRTEVVTDSVLRYGVDRVQYVGVIHVTIYYSYFYSQRYFHTDPSAAADLMDQ